MNRFGNPALLIMAKWPAPGQVKTRLAPPLSDEEAALLYKEMLLDVVADARRLQGRVEKISVMVGFHPPERRADFEALLPGVPLIAQRGADLAARMDRCFAEAFGRGFAPVLMRNSDAPTLPSRIIEEALEKLQSADVALSPDASQGYGLIGLRAPARLFTEPLTTENSYAETLSRCARLGLEVAPVEGWYDVDGPRDLRRLLKEWRAGATGPHVTRFLDAHGEAWEKRLEASMTISVIIPAKNEAANLPPLLEQLRGFGAGERIVVDGGSSDDTARVARAGGARVLLETDGLAAQLNRGAFEASGEALFFLPADTRLLCDPFAVIEKTLAAPQVVAGGFALDYGERLRYRMLAALADFRARRMGLPMGDQGLFIRRGAFEKLRGFRRGPLLPDLDLMRRARALGEIALCAERIHSSPRRYEQNGLLRNTAANQVLFYGQLFFPDEAPRWARRLLERLRRREG